MYSNIEVVLRIIAITPVIVMSAETAERNLLRLEIIRRHNISFPSLLLFQLKMAQFIRLVRPYFIIINN